MNRSCLDRSPSKNNKENMIVSRGLFRQAIDMYTDM